MTYATRQNQLASIAESVEIRLPFRGTIPTGCTAVLEKEAEEAEAYAKKVMKRVEYPRPSDSYNQ